MKRSDIIIKPGMTFTVEDLDRITGLVKTATIAQMNGEADRISADSLCPVCGWPAGKHPMCGRVLDHNSEPFLNVLCGGRRVKL